MTYGCTMVAKSYKKQKNRWNKRKTTTTYSLNFLRDFSLNENAEQELLKVVENSPRSFDEIMAF